MGSEKDRERVKAEEERLGRGSAEGIRIQEMRAREMMPPPGAYAVSKAEMPNRFKDLKRKSHLIANELRRGNGKKESRMMK